MKFLIVTHVPHFASKDTYYAYGPYVKEMNIWAKHVGSFHIVSPLKQQRDPGIDLPYEHIPITHTSVPSFSLTNALQILKALFLVPFIGLKIFWAMRKADHIHLRCPGNMGLLGCMAQVFFPKKLKTAKYAGNWDPRAKQPWSYRLQKKILSHTLFTKNMKVLVYGEWPHQSKNIVPFFTATYTKEKIEEPMERSYNSPYRCMFVGTLSPGKQPKYAVEIVQALREQGFPCTLDFYGEGAEFNTVKKYIEDHNLNAVVTLHGNQKASVVEQAYRESHFLLLPSRSEGWPKVVAEAMFWGCIPITTRVSCVPWMLDGGNRGVLLKDHHAENIEELTHLLKDTERLKRMKSEGERWSHQYTLDRFEEEIKNFLK